MVEPVIKFNCFSYRKTALFQDVFVSLMGKYFFTYKLELLRIYK